MKRNFHPGIFVAVILSLVSTTTLASPDKDKKDKAPKFLDNVPPWETYEEPPSVIFAPPPVYVRQDEDGNVVSTQIETRESGGYEITKKIIPLAVLDRVNDIRHIIYLEEEDSTPDDQQPFPGPTNLETLTCPLPESWTIAIVDDDTVVGNTGANDTSKPADTDTQWMSFDFYSENYSGIGSHMALPLWARTSVTTLYGWGAALGDLSYNFAGSEENGNRVYRGCGFDVPYTSQIEGFDCKDSFDRENCTNALYNGSESCGVDYVDGPAITQEGEEVPRYRFEMQASEGHFVSYRMWEYKFLMGWTVITGWNTLNVDTTDYYNGIGGGPFDADWSWVTEGIYIGATVAPGFSGTATINISNVRCGWF